jgi:DNA-binding transcriptional ArsR family regulator
MGPPRVDPDVVVLFATLGFTPAPVLAPLASPAKFSAMHVFFGPPGHPDVNLALEAARAECQRQGVRLLEHPVHDAFDYTAYLHAFADARAAQRGRIVFNASGGTRVAIMAATLYCYTHEIPLVYHNETDPRIAQEVPLKAIRSLSEASTTRRAIVGLLQQSGPRDMTSLSTKLKRAASTITGHVQDLERAGIVHVERVGRRREVRLATALSDVRMKAVRA